jgi:hypothetical protein
MFTLSERTWTSNIWIGSVVVETSLTFFALHEWHIRHEP